MSKIIEDSAQDLAGINEDKATNYSFSYNKYDIADAYQQGADFGYNLAENRVKKEYEEKIRWITIEEKRPENNKIVEAKLKKDGNPIFFFYKKKKKKWYISKIVLGEVEFLLTDLVPVEWRYFL